MGRFARRRRDRRDVAAKRATTRRSASPTSGTALASPADVNGVAPPALDLWRDELASVPTDEKVRIALELERATKAADPRIRNVESASYGDALAEAALANSLGVEAHAAPHDVLARRRSRSPTTARARRPGYGFVAGRTLADLDLDSIPRDAATRACRLLGAKPDRRPAHPGDPRSARDPFGARRAVERVQRRVDAEGPFAVRGPRRRADRRAVRAR